MKYIILFLILTLYYNARSQNYIYNYDFETADGGNSWPTDVAQADKMTSWETRTKSVGTIDLHSPDWINNNGTGTQTILGVHPSPHGGNGMIGMTNYELIQQNFNNQNVEGDSYHTLSMWVYITDNPPRGSKNCRLKVMFSKTKLKYKNEAFYTDNQQASDLCTDDYTNYRDLSSNWTTIHEFDFNSLNLTPNSWQKISFTFKTPSNSIMHSYDYIALELRKNGFIGTGSSGDICQDSYIFIDDISLQKSDFCNAACAPNLGTITHGTFQNAMMVLGAPFSIIFQDAIGIELKVYDRFGHLMITVDAFDPNGLKDVGYNDYQFLWSGANANGSPLFPQDVYNYSLRYWNCHDDHTYYDALTYLPTNFGGQAEHPNFHNYDLIDCCPNDRYIQNTTYIGNYVHTAKNNIWAGDHVTSSQTYGDVIINSGVNVKYVAKNISLQSGFYVKPGAEFHAITTEDCVYQSIQRKGFKERYFISEENTKLLNNVVNNKVLIYPNPSKGIFSIKSVNGEILNIEVYNYTGSIIITYNKENFNSFINLENESNGTYFYKVVLDNGNVISGKLIKTD